MDNYARLNIRKLKTHKELDDTYKHNERIFRVDNADPTRQDLNIEVVDTLGRTYEELYEESLSTMAINGVPQKTVRKDAVKGFEVILGYSRERDGTIDMDKWIKANLEWLEKRFNPPDRKVHFKDISGEEKEIPINNVRHVVVHRDESNVHIHAFVVPIDENGRLSAYHYVQGRGSLSRLQDEYAKAMEPFGLERGEKHTTATAEQVTKYYALLKKAVASELPEPEIGESVIDYRARANEVYQTALANHRNEIVKMTQKNIHEHSVRVSEKIEEDERQRAIESQLKKLQGALDVPEIDDEAVREIADIVQKEKRLEQALDEEPNKRKAEQFRKQMQDMLNHQMEKERREVIRKKKETTTKR